MNYKAPIQEYLKPLKRIKYVHMSGQRKIAHSYCFVRKSHRTVRGVGPRRKLQLTIRYVSS